MSKLINNQKAPLGQKAAKLRLKDSWSKPKQRFSSEIRSARAGRKQLT